MDGNWNEGLKVLGKIAAIFVGAIFLVIVLLAFVFGALIF